MNKKILAKNTEGLFNYEIMDKLTAGIVLSGPEVKSIKNSRLSLKGSYIRIDHDSEAWLINCHVAPYEPAKNVQMGYDPQKPRKLLLRKKEISSLIGKSKQKGLTIIPTSVYNNKGLIKVEIALVKGKTKVDKRESIKKREVDRQIKRTLKQR